MSTKKAPDAEPPETVPISAWHPSFEVPYPLPPALTPNVEPQDHRSFVVADNGRHVTSQKDGSERLNRLREQLYAPSPSDRKKAARELASLGLLARDALPDLESRLKDPSNGVRDAARLALLVIQRQAASAARPRWEENKQIEGITAPEFVLTHYRSEINAGTLTGPLLRAADRYLYDALMTWRRRRRHLPPQLQHILPPRQHGKKVLRTIEVVPEDAVAKIRAEIANIRSQISSMTGSNTLKAEINADIAQIEHEIDRPLPRRSALKLFLESLRDNLAKAAGAAAAAGSIAIIGAILAKYFGAF